MAVKLTPGNTYDIVATVLDSLGGPATLEDPAFTQAGTPDDIITLTTTGDTTATVLAVAPGSDTVTYFGQDGFDNGVTGEVELEVADATALRLRAHDSLNCALRHDTTNGTVRLLVIVPPEPAGDPSFTLDIVAVDELGRQNHAYTLADGPDSVSLNGNIILNGHGAGDPNPDDADVPCIASARGAETITATAVTDGSGATITGVLQVLIVTASTVSLTVKRTPLPA